MFFELPYIHWLPHILQASLYEFQHLFLAGVVLGPILFYLVRAPRTRRRIFLLALLCYLVSEVAVTVIFRDPFLILLFFLGIPALGLTLGMPLCWLACAIYRRLKKTA